MPTCKCICVIQYMYKYICILSMSVQAIFTHRNYLETLLELPWSHSTPDHLDLAQARQDLEADHYGLEKLKKRVLEYLAVRQLKNNLKGNVPTYSYVHICMYSTSQKKVPVPFPYNGGSTVLRLKKDCAKTLHERYGCVFTERFTTRLYHEAFSSTVYVM